LITIILKSNNISGFVSQMTELSVQIYVQSMVNMTLYQI